MGHARGGGLVARETTGLRLGLYARVSTQEQQTLALQRDAMTADAAPRGGAIVLAIEEVSSGAHERRCQIQSLVRLVGRKINTLRGLCTIIAETDVQSS